MMGKREHLKIEIEYLKFEIECLKSEIEYLNADLRREVSSKNVAWFVALVAFLAWRLL